MKVARHSGGRTVACESPMVSSSPFFTGFLRMFSCSTARRAILIFVALILSGSLVQVSSAADLPAVRTLSGSGISGVRDGDASTARFDNPTGIVYDAAGNLIVADTAAQRIRKVDRLGHVTTIAGGGESILFGTGSAGAYKDGDTAQARFNQPSAVAVDRRGDIFVADTANHCIRKISHGRVTTVAGSPTVAGAADGPIASASFTRPRGIAVDHSGTIYVADPPNGLREISPDGTVTTLKQRFLDAAWSVSIYEGRDGARLLASTPRQIAVYSLPDFKFIAEIETEQLYSLFPPREGAEFLGPPSTAAAISANEIVYTDNLLSTIHLVQLGTVDQVRVLNRQPLLNAGNRGGGFHDGPGENAQFDQPMGVAVAPSGEIAVADTGNKRIRLLSTFDHRSAAISPAALPDAPDSHQYRVALLGNSYVWTNVPWGKSIAGVIEAKIESDLRFKASGRKIKVFPLRKDGMRFDAEASYAQSVLGTGLFDYVVLFIPTYGQFTLHGDLQVVSDPAYSLRMADSLKAVNVAVSSGGGHTLAVLHPGAFDMPNEMTYRKFFESVRDPGDVERHYEEAKAATKRSGVDTLDLWPQFFALDSRADNQSLFGAWDHHFTYLGNQIVGESIANRILAEHPWRK